MIWVEHGTGQATEKFAFLVQPLVQPVWPRRSKYLPDLPNPTTFRRKMTSDSHKLATFNNPIYLNRYLKEISPRICQFGRKFIWNNSDNSWKRGLTLRRASGEGLPPFSKKHQPQT